ncbi:hypothetical protein TSUD_139720 [Trifolium subterraneum]|uniref:Late embryogenesis abundant protein LEA-2 subgroup domain-containing protein n=1 Tax=Trifolium subterraneum TaxID=3900 RepID=A0A2Z6NGL6_TRISU|nr:hypothetical protein TSUD_139720 [Trifolium subterraneum]
MHTKTDSEVTSVATSSPARSPPRRPIYYVQSPSRDSHDGEKTVTTSFHSSPVLSPVASPHHSSSTGFSAPQRKKEHQHHQQQHSLKPWKQIDVIDEEGFLQGEDRNSGFSRRCYFLAFVVGFFVLFSLFSLILLGASKHMKPKITIKSIKFDHVTVQAGSDSTGVATDMISMNSTLKFTYRNTGTFFGVHVPLYGSGASLSSTTGMPTLPVPLNLNFVMRSRANVLGKLVKPKYYKRIHCSITLDPKKLGAQVSLKKSCTYD